MVVGVWVMYVVDVYVIFFCVGIFCMWIIECKLWKLCVIKEKVFVFKSIVEDVGVDCGIIVSEMGF